MSIKAVLFDMDGVLIDAKDWHYETLDKALRLFGSEISREEHLSIFDGLPTMKKLQMLTQRGKLPQELHGFINDLKQSYTMAAIVNNCFPIYQHEYALSRLKKEGYKIAVCSNSIRKTIETMMTKSALMPYIDVILSNQDVERAKPDPEIYLKAMTCFGLKPKECVIAEDNFNGIQAAIASGGYLFKVDTVWDVTYENLRRRIDQIEGEVA